MEDKIQTFHPTQGKTGRNIDKKIYDRVKAAILKVLQNKELTHTELFDALNKELKGKFPGNINWYGETLKLDLESRKIIQRFPSKPYTKYKIK